MHPRRCLLLALRDLGGAPREAELPLRQLRNPCVERRRPLRERLHGRLVRRLGNLPGELLHPRGCLVLPFGDLGGAAGKAELPLRQLRDPRIEHRRASGEQLLGFGRVGDGRLRNRRERGAQLVELRRGLLLSLGECSLTRGEPVGRLRLCALPLLLLGELGGATRELHLPLRQLHESTVESGCACGERFDGRSVRQGGAAAARVRSRGDRGPQLVELRGDIAFARGERGLTGGQALALLLERGDPLGHALLEPLHEPLGHPAIIRRVSLDTRTAKEAADTDHERGEQACSEPRPGADGREPRQLRPGRRRGRGRLAGVTDRGVGLALKALQDGEALLELGSRAGRALARCDGVQELLVAANRRGQLALEARRPLLDEPVGERVRELGGSGRRRVLDRDRDDVARTDDMRIERGEQRVAGACEPEVGAHDVCDLRRAKECGGARGCGPLAARVTQDVETGERRIVDGDGRDEQLRRRAILLRRRQSVPDGRSGARRGEREHSEPGAYRTGDN